MESAFPASQRSQARGGRPTLCRRAQKALPPAVLQCRSFGTGPPWGGSERNGGGHLSREHAALQSDAAPAIQRTTSKSGAVAGRIQPSQLTVIRRAIASFAF